MSIFVPHNIESRIEKLRRDNLKMLQNEIIEGDLIIDQNYDFKEDQVKVRIIRGHVLFNIFSRYIPEWLKNVRIEGSLNLSYCNLSSLENCPQYIQGNFLCEYNCFTSVKGGPKYVGGNYNIGNNYAISINEIKNSCTILGEIIIGSKSKS